jgi:hypothetical protein
MIFNTSFPSAFYVTEYEINNQLKLFSSLEAIIGSIMSGLSKKAWVPRVSHSLV